MADARRRKRASWGQRMAFAVCLLFALVGAVPLAFGALVRTPAVQRWAAAKTSALLHDQLKIDATYQVQVKPWPLAVALDNVVVESSDGGVPFATVERVAVRPGIFALLAGRLDVGDVEITGAKIHAVVRNGKLDNLAFEPPKSEAEEEEKSKAPEVPLTSVSITDASVDLDLDGTIIALREVDVDVAKAEGGVEVSLRTGAGELLRKHPFVGRPDEDAVDEDTLCHLDARARVEPRAIVIRRLSITASVDFDPDAGTRPGCNLDPDDWRRVELQIAGTRVTLDDAGDVREIDGRVHARVPVSAAHRFVDMGKATGIARVDASIQYARGDTLPRVHGSISAERIGLDGKIFSKHFDGSVAIGGDTIVVSNGIAEWANGRFVIPAVTLWPLAKGIPLEARDITGDDVNLPGLLRDLGAHPQAYVGWTLEHASVPRFGGTLDPLALEGALAVKTKDFGVYDRPASSPDRRRMVSISEGNVDGVLAINPKAVVLRNMHAVTPRSNIVTTVLLGFDDEFGIDVAPGSHVDLGELSPLAAVQIGGDTQITAHGTGTFTQPHVEGDVAIKGFSVGGFQAGDIVQAKAVFEPLYIQLSAVELHRGASVITSNRARVDFRAGADVLVDADVDTNTREGLSIRDFFQVFKFADDPRFASIEGIARGSARVHYAIGGAEDKCGGGYLGVRMKSALERPKLFGEEFDSGALDVNFVWDDKDASGEGMTVDVYSATLKDGTGSLMAQAEVRHGGVLRGNVVASGYPLGRFESLGSIGKNVDGEASAIGTLGGTLARMEAHLDVTLTPIRIGAETLPASHFAVGIEPDATPTVRVGTTRCQNPIGGPFVLADYEKDTPDGQFRVSGAFFDGQVRLTDVTMSRQRNAVIAGNVFLSNLDLGKLANLLPRAALSNSPVDGRLSAKISINHLQASNLPATSATVEVLDFHASQGTRSVELDDATAPIVIANDSVIAPEMKLTLQDSHGLAINATASGNVASVFTAPTVDASLSIAPFDLAKLKGDLDGVDRIAGTLAGGISVKGPISAPRVTGDVKLRDGALALTGVPMALDKVLVDIAIGGGELRIVRASANVGAGTLDVTGRVPLVGLGLGTGTANITARNIKVPIDDGFDVTVGADLVATYKPDALGGRSLPDVQGKVEIAAFNYTRPIGLNLNLTELSKSIKRTEVQAYDPSADILSFDVKVVSPKPLRVENDLVDMRLAIDDRGIEISGTDQRYGARGSLRILPESKIRLRNHEFDVREGSIRFDDPTKVKADVDVRAVTEFKRNASSSDSGATDASSTTSGQWDIAIRAHGETNDLKLDLSSDPPLDQEDIVLLLTIGMTRAEIDRGLASSLGETVGLEALSALTGADKAVQNIVPIIDYFHFGSSYSSHTGRTEPNVTVGKRLTDDVNASVTTSLTQREVGATLEWRLKKGVSIDASYDNTSDVNSTIGNLGADLRWHLEFE